MKSFLQNLLVLFALSLCGLIAFQWVRETDTRKEVQRLYDRDHDKSETIQSLQSQLRSLGDEVKRLDGLKNDLTATVKSNRLEIARLNNDLDKAGAENEKNQAQLKVYKEAVQTANDNILRQNEEIKKQNELMKTLGDERNEIVLKLNDMVLKYNKLATNFSDLVDKWNKQQEELARASTNAPPKK